MASHLKQFWARLKYYVFGLFQKINQHHVWLLSGGLTFSVFVCILPLILITFSILGNILQYSSVEHQVISFIQKAIPNNAYAESFKEIIFSRIHEVIKNKSQAGIFGVLGLLIAASGLFGSMRTILNLIYKSNVERPLLIHKLKDLGIVVLVLVFFLVSIVFLPSFEVAKEVFKRSQSFDEVSRLLIFLGDFTPFIIIFMAFFFLYYAVPDRLTNKKIAFISALSAAILWEIAKQAFGYYVSNLTSWKQIYGAYTLFVFIAFWVYYSSFVFIIGAEIGQLYSEEKSKLPKKIRSKSTKK